MSELMRYLPPYYDGSDESRTIQEAFQPELDGLWRFRNELFLQLNPNTATWGLAFWEQAFGIALNTATTLDLRRAAVVGKIRGSGTTTKSMVQNVCKGFIDGTVDVVEIPKESRIELNFYLDEAQIPVREALDKALVEILPAHLSYEAKYFDAGGTAAAYAAAAFVGCEIVDSATAICY